MFKIDLARTRWNQAIEAWLNGDGSKLSALLRGPDPIPDFVRAFVANIAEGKAARKRGPKKRVPPFRDAIIQVEFPLEVEKQKAIKKLWKKFGMPCEGTPTEMARASIGRWFNLSAEAVKSIVSPPNPGKKESKTNTKKSR